MTPVHGLTDGEVLATLYLGSSDWIHRRVESLRMDSTGATRLFVSVDFTLPEMAIVRGPHAVLPLAMMRKGALRRLDAFDSSGRTMPVLSSLENGELVVNMLHELAKRALPSGAAMGKRCRQHLEEVVYCDPRDARTARARFRGWLSAQRHFGQPNQSVEAFTALVGQFSENFLLAALVDSELVGRRTIVKYAHEDDVPDAGKVHVPTIVFRDIPNFSMAASLHFEIEAPPGLGLRRLELVQTETDGEVSGAEVVTARRPRDPEAILHAGLHPSHRFTRGRAAAWISPPRRGLCSVTFVSAALTFAAVAIAALNRFLPGSLVQPDATTTSVASILLAGPALFLSWLSRASEHLMVARLLWPLRRTLTFSSLVLFVMAFTMALPLESPWDDRVAVGLVLAQAVLLVQASSFLVSVGRET